MATLQFFDSFFEKVNEGVFNLGTDTLKIYLSNTAPNAGTHDEKADIAEIASTSNGYTANGVTLANLTSIQTAGVYKLVNSVDLTITQAGANAIGPFQYAILYDDTVSGDPLIGWWDAGAPITLGAATGDSVTLNLDQTNGILRARVAD